MRALRILPFLVVPAAAFPGCDCGGQVFEIAPQIYLDACKSPDKVVGTTHVGGYEQCGIDFGARDISVKETKTIKVTNPSTVELHLDDVSLIGDPSFQLVTEDFKHNKVGLGKGDTIGPGLSGSIVVSVRPNTATLIKTTLFIKSDAKNTPQTPDHQSLVQVPITATGVDNGTPQIDVSPLECNYDRVPVDGVKVCTVTIANKGVRGLVLDSVDFVPPGTDPNGPQFQVPSGSDPTKAPFAFAGRPPSPDEEIEPTNPNASPPVLPITLDVQFRPDVLGTYLGKFRILSNDPQKGSIDVTLQGTAVTPPTCTAKIKSVNGTPVSGTQPEIQPLDDVVFSLEDSAASTPNGSIATYQWNIEKAPTESHATLSTPNAVDTGMTFDSDGIHAGVDFAGDYKICGQVGDDLGVNSVNECCVSFSAIPKQNFHVELSWDTAVNDFDLHITKGVTSGSSEQFCISDTDPPNAPTGLLTQACSNNMDCNFATCKRDNDSAPVWDPPNGTPHDASSPTLDVDDIDGFGPENQNVDTMTPGDYLIGINEYQGTSQNGATAQVQIFIYGQLAGSFFKPMNPGDYWEVAVVHWYADPTKLPCVEDLTDGNATNQCGP